MKIKDVVKEIERKIEEKYGPMEIEEIWNWCFLELSKYEYKFDPQNKVGEEDVEVEKDGLKIKAKVNIYKTEGDNLRFFIELLETEVEVVRQGKRLAQKSGVSYI